MNREAGDNERGRENKPGGYPEIESLYEWVEIPSAGTMMHMMCNGRADAC